MGLPPATNPTTVEASMELQNSTPDVQRLLDIKKTYQYWQEHIIRESDKTPKDSKNPANPNKVQLLSNSNALLNNQNIFTEQDMLFLKSRLDEIVSKGFRIKSNEVDQLVESCLMGCLQGSQGFDPYGTKDEEGLHDEYCLSCDEDDDAQGDMQDDYDIEEVLDENGFLHGHPGTTHHIEVELNDGPPRIGSPDPEEPSCEFTFEYDSNGKLLTTPDAIEENLRRMNLTAQLQIGYGGTPKTSSKKKKKKKKRSSSVTNVEGEVSGAIDESLCLFCQYEAFYGHKPEHIMRWLENKMMEEGTRRKKLKEKLESVKQAAAKSLRTEQDHGEELDGSLNTVVDN